MSKKKIHSRLDDLFADLEQDAQLAPVSSPRQKDREGGELESLPLPIPEPIQAAAAEETGGAEPEAISHPAEIEFVLPEEPPAEGIHEPPLTWFPDDQDSGAAQTAPPAGLEVPQKPPPPSGEADQIIPTPTPDAADHLRAASTASGRSDTSPGSAQAPASLKVPIRLPESSPGLLEILDDSPDRRWSSDEQRLVEQVADQLSLALENAHLFQLEQRRANELNMLVELSRIISENLDLEEIYQTAYTKIGQLISTESFFINLLDEKTHEFITAYMIDKGERLPVSRFSAEVGFSGFIARTKKPYIAYDLRVEETPFPRQNYPAVPEDEEVRSVIAVPLQFSGEVIGAISAQSYLPEVYTEYDLMMLSTFADHIGVAIQNARLYMQEQQRRQVADTLREIAQVIGATLDLNEVIERMLDRLDRLILFSQASIELVNKGQRQLIGSRGFHPTPASGLRSHPWIPLSSDPLLVEVALSKKPLLINDTQTEHRWTLAQREGVIRSWLAAPMLVGDEVVGVLTLAHTHPGIFSEDTAEMASAVAAQAAVAIQNARLFEQSQNTLVETETLYLASAELNTAQKYADVLGALQRYTLIGFRSSTSSILFFDHPWTREQQPEGLEVLAEASDASDPAGKTRRLLAEYPLPTSLLRPDQPLFIPDIEQERQANPELRYLMLKIHQARSAIFLPIVVSGQWWGCVQAFYPEKSTFSDNQVRQAIALVNQAGVALQNLRNIELAEQRAAEAQQRSEELSLINRVVSAVVSSNDLHLVMNTLAQELFTLFSLTSAEVALLDSQSRFLTIVASRSRTSQAALSIGEEIRCDLFPAFTEIQATRSAVMVADIHTNPLTAAQKERLETQGVESLVVLPIISGTNLLGVVGLGTGKGERLFTAQDLRLTETLVAQLSTAIQNANLFEQIQTALEETETLYQGSAELNSIQSYDDILNILRKYTIVGRKETINVTINLFERPWIKSDIPDSYRPIARWAISPYTETPNIRFPLKTWSNVHQVLRPDAPVLIHNTAEDPRMDQTLRTLYVERLDAHTLLFAPLNVGGSWIGFISSVYFQNFQVHEAELRRLMTLASQACVAIQNIRLLEETKRRAAQLETAAEIARDTSGTLALDTLLKRAVNLIRERYGYYHASIFLMEDNGTHASIRESTGEAGEEMKRQDYKLAVGSRSIIGHVTERGIPLVINDVTQDPIHRPNPLLPETRAELGIPLKIGSRVIGAIDVQSVEINAFNPDDIAVIQTLADQIAVAVDNARSYELAQKAIQETEQRVQELSVLFDINQALANVSVEPVEIAQIVALKLFEVMEVSHCSVFMLQEDRSPPQLLADLVMETRKDGSKSMAPSEKPMLQMAEFYQAARPLQPVIARKTDALADPLLLAAIRDNRFATLIILPLVAKGEAVGFVCLAAIEESYGYTHNQLNLALTVANAAAVALENARLYEEQRQIMDMLREVDKLKSQFLANMSHELRTPLNSIIGFSRVILKGIDGPINDIQKQDLTAIHNSGTHLLRLINNVLDISKIEAGKMELTITEDVSLPELINGVISTTIALVKDKPVRLEKIISPDLPLVRCDPTRINQVMLNLMSNASKFTEEGSITLDAGVQTGPDGYPEVVIRVIDSGEGISKEDQKKLFLPFSQVDESATRKTGGSGLGLSISRLLVEMHGGRIGVISDTGKGSTFYFTLPLPAPDPADQEEEEQRLILTIDDERQVLDLYARYLKENGYRVIRLSNPAQAVQRALEIQPYAITLDVMMPGRNGWQVLEDLKNHPQTRHIPVIICSIIEDQAKGFSLGATDYLMKPIMEEDLVKALDRLNGDGGIQHVLIVDDDADDLNLLARVLEKSYNVRKALGGQAGLAALEEMTPNAVVLDLFMPDLDGFTLLEHLRSKDSTRNIPAIIFTAGDLTEEQHKKLSEFSMNMVSKSNFSEDEFLRVLKETIEKFTR
jgi:GAF domain-containing protein/CheY-like chemotaxis protein